MRPDPRSVAGKQLPIAERVQILIVGAGPAGLAAARRAVDGGAQVMLIDEFPVPYETMGESVPQFWGGRMGGALRNRNEMMARALEIRPELSDLFEAGVDIRLGTACWGLFVNQDNLGWMPGPVAGLHDPAEGSSLVGFDRAIIATGRRDMGLAFAGWDQPGVMGAGAAVMLARLYGALDSRRAIMLGATDEALLAACDLIDQGLIIAAIVEQGDTVPARPELIERLRAHGAEILTDHVPDGVTTGPEGVTSLRLKSGRQIACDTVLLGIGAVPMIDLLQGAGAICAFDAARGGFVPVINAAGQTSLTTVHAIGDCAGIWPEKSADLSVAEAEARNAANDALQALELVDEQPVPAAPMPPRNPVDLGAYRKAWLRACAVDAMKDLPICQCEEVTAREILEVRPPRYLDAPMPANAPRSLAAILGDGPPDPDQVKRLTRAGMGPCQGRRCREQIQALLALQEDLPLSAIPLAGYRSPVRPMPLTEAALPEDTAISAAWDSWFGMPRQWLPYWEAVGSYTVASLSEETDHVSE